jgi:hypothetical protein
LPTIPTSRVIAFVPGRVAASDLIECIRKVLRFAKKAKTAHEVMLNGFA